jgi:hypothetical protein
MCLIVDNDVAHRVFLKPDDPDFKYVFGCLFGKRLPAASIVYGGKLKTEYLGNTALIAPLLELRRVGRARIVDDSLIEHEMSVVTESGLCGSNDSHNIALARIASVGLLCSLDKALARDFTNPALIANPRGKVYKHASHRKLLPQFCP